MSAVLYLIVLPSVIAFIFAVYVAYYAFADVSERQFENESQSNVHRLKIEVPNQP